MMKYESNDKFWNELLGAELVSAFTQAEKVRLYFKTDDGRIIRVKIPIDYYDIIEKKVV